jgi:hypothetical protein
MEEKMRHYLSNINKDLFQSNKKIGGLILNDQ